MRKVKFRDLFEQYRIQHIVQDDIDYGQITISKNGYIKFRTTKNGKTIGRKRQFVIDLEQYPNTLLFTRQGVAEGAIAFAPKEVNGCITTENMPMFSLKNGIDRKFVELLLKSEQYTHEVKKLIPTGSAQKSIHERDLMQIILTVPSEEEQKKLSCLIENRLNNIDMLNSEISTQQTLLKKLRQSILQEAIEGKLTKEWREQNPDVESASVLLEKIKQEKEQLIKEKKIKKQKPLPPIKEEEIPFDIPDGWVWCRLGDVCTYGSSPKIEPRQINNAMWILDLEDIEKESSKLLQKIRGDKRKTSSTKSKFYKGNVLYSKLRPYLDKVIVADEDGVCTTEILPLYFYGGINSYYSMYTLKRKDFLHYVNNITKGVKMPRLSTKDGQKSLYPLPPLQEQKEIVKKIENLFKICDELETQIEASKKSSEQLIEAVLKEAFKE